MMVLLLWHHNMQEYPNAIFVHCYAHRLNLVLAESASFIKEVKVFFATLSLAVELVLPSPQKGLKHRIPTLGKAFLLSHLLDGSTIADLLETVHEYREGIENQKTGM
jgi:hypothetical protein